MKLRFKDNSLRLRLNQREVTALASGEALERRIVFPGNRALQYTLHSATEAAARFEDGEIRLDAAAEDLRAWAQGEEIGLYYQFPAGRETLSIAIEKDLACIDGPPEEQDPLAFPRTADATC